MNKLSSEEVGSVLSQVGPALRALSEENQELRAKVAHYEKRDRCEKLAAQMESKKLDPDSNYQEKVASLMEQPNLDVVEQAINMSAPQIKLAEVSDHTGNPSDAKSAFEAAIMGG